MPFYLKLNNRMKSMDHCTSIIVEQHFRSDNHHFNRHARFAFIERIETPPPQIKPK